MNITLMVQRLFNQYRPELKRSVQSTLGNADDAEDIVQDAFHNLIRMESLEKVENPRAFLHKTATNLALNHLRKNRYRQSHIESLDPEEQSPTLEREVFAIDDVEKLQKRIHSLPELTREVFLLNRMSGLSYTEIGKQLNLSNSQVQKHISKALSFLRKFLD